MSACDGTGELLDADDLSYDVNALTNIAVSLASPVNVRFMPSEIPDVIWLDTATVIGSKYVVYSAVTECRVMNSTNVVCFDVDNVSLWPELTTKDGLVVHRICPLPWVTTNDPVCDGTFVMSSLDVGMPARNLSPH